jgi:hypothetical protein
MRRTANAQFIGSLQATLPTRLKTVMTMMMTKIFSIPVADPGF